MQDNKETQIGLIAALGAFFIWGLAPLYFKYLQDMPATEILAHRSIWSFVLALLMLVVLGRLPNFRQTLCNLKLMRILALSGLLIGGNWLVFIWAVTHSQMTEASLGYYINPLVNILLGVCFLGERLRLLQWAAVLLAFIGVGHEVWLFGRLPMVALYLAFSFGIYGLVRKAAPVESLTGLCVETLYMLPLALAYLLWSDSPSSNMFNNGFGLNGVLMFGGPLTLVPLLLFTIAAKRLRLSTLGILQYLGPSLMLVLAVKVFGENFSKETMLSFSLVWCGLLVFTADAFMQRRREREIRSLAVVASALQSNDETRRY
ncbi:MAG: EamA family transporter RarD [Parahaliea sp.]